MTASKRAAQINPLQARTPETFARPNGAHGDYQRPAVVDRQKDRRIETIWG